MAVLVLGARWLWAQRPAEASGVQRVAELGSDEGESPGGADAAEVTDEGSGEPTEDDAPDAPPGARPDGEEAGADLVVHVTGAVEEPGVVELPAGSRVVDAVRAAGGLTGEADQSSVNLARTLVDGEQLWVGRPGEEPPAGWSPPAAEGPGRGAGGAAGASGAQPAPLDLNTATQADLEELPGIGPVTAGHILAWRDEHGRFSRVDELLEVSGIGERTLAQLEPLVTVGG
ncbi:MAG: competence protein ComEA [Acidobacteria bacterium]|nr:MAG: competence protein ComEA [Acidobacteriota bacterium]